MTVNSKGPDVCKHGMVAMCQRCDMEALWSRLGAVTAERDRYREALRRVATLFEAAPTARVPAVQMYETARDALEGVTTP